MKRYHFFLLLTCLFAAALIPQLSFAQRDKDAAQVQELINNQHYIFKAQSVTPLSGAVRQLTSQYDLQISKEVIISQLPYFGRAYSATLNLSDAGIQFTSKDFEYVSTNRKKGGWNINIKYKDTQDVKQMQLSIFDNGTASLQVTSNNRQSISYNGYITNPDKDK